MKRSVKYLHFVGMVAASSEQSLALRDARDGEGRQMSTYSAQAGKVHA